MSHQIDLQIACQAPLPVSSEAIKQWAGLALSTYDGVSEITIRCVDSNEMKTLNHTYRHQNKTTNVLAFPSDIPPQLKLEYDFLGDVVICPDVLQQEHQALQRSLHDHWAHIVIHGVLHLQGYDHIEEKDAFLMKALEKNLLAQINIGDPYQHEDQNVE